MKTLLTKRDHEILDALTKRVRVLSLHQIARTWWSESADTVRVAENRLRLLAEEKLIVIERTMSHPEIKLEAPAVVWSLDQPDPNFGPVSHQLQSRWSQHPVLTPCVSATKTAADRFGGNGGRPPRSVERTHDIHMAQVYLTYRTRHPELVRHWVFEEQIKAERKRAGGRSQDGEKLPDVILRTSSGVRVIEFGGAYSKDKLSSFHRYCKEHFFSYEVW